MQVTDDASQADTQTRSLQVTAAGNGSLAVGTTTLANGQVGTAYNQTLTASGGTGTYTWLVTNGSLPAVLTLNTTTGVIGGTPTTAQTALSIVISNEQTQGGGGSGAHGRCKRDQPRLRERTSQQGEGTGVREPRLLAAVVR